jgi:hypothetical protein
MSLALTTPNGSAPISFAFDLSQLTQLASTPSSLSSNTDGASAGSLTTFTVGQAGEITGVYSNGYKQPLGQIALASFSNPSGLLLDRAGGGSGTRAVPHRRPDRVAHPPLSSDIRQSSARRVDEDLGPLGGVGAGIEAIQDGRFGAEVDQRIVGLGSLLEQADDRVGARRLTPFQEQRAQGIHRGLARPWRVPLGAGEQALGVSQGFEGVRHG